MEKDRLSRKLAVILHADVVGSTVLVQQNETLAHERIQAAFNNFSETIKSYGGETREIRGDALVAEFARASDAVCAAIDFQQGNSEHNSQIEDAVRPELRVGIAMGEVVIADNTVTGGGVVMAQRLEQLAETGGICVQGAIHETVPRRMPFVYHSLGEQQLKGFEEPVRVFGVALKPGEALPPGEPGAGVSAGVEQSPKRKQRKSTILLAPIEAMGKSDDVNELCAAVEESIQSSLANSTGSLLVTSAEDADFEVRISLQMIQKKYRSTLKLIDLTTREQFSSVRFDGECVDLFETVDRLSIRISTAIRNNMLLRESEASKSIPLEAKTIEDLLNEAGTLSLRSDMDSLERAQSILDRVLELEPENFMALAMKAQCCVLIAFCGFRPVSRESGELALTLLRKARQLNSNSDFVHLSLSIVRLYYQSDLESALRSVRRSLELNTGWINPYGLMGRIEIYLGKADQGIDNNLRAIETYPQSEMVFFFSDSIALGNFALAEYGNAIEWAIRAQELHPNFMPSMLLQISSYAHLEKRDEADREAKRLLALHPDFNIAEMRVWPFRDPANWDRLVSGLHSAGLPA